MAEEANNQTGAGTNPPSKNAGNAPPNNGASTAPDRPDKPAGATPAPRKPQIGDTIPAPVVAAAKTGSGSGDGAAGTPGAGTSASAKRRRRRRGRGGGGTGGGAGSEQGANAGSSDGGSDDSQSQPQGQRQQQGQAQSQRQQQGQGRQGQGRSGQGRSQQNQSQRQGAADGDSGESSGAQSLADEGAQSGGEGTGQPGSTANRRKRSRNRGRGRGSKPSSDLTPVDALLGDDDDPIELDEDEMARRRGKSRKGKVVGRYQMNVHVAENGSTHLSILEGRQLLEYYVSRPSDDEFQIHGNIYLGRVENVLPGMEAAFIDIGTPKNAVLYRGDVSFDPKEVDTSSGPPRIEDVLSNRQMVLCQVTKNPIAHKGARVTQEVSLPGRFVVLVPNNSTYGISKRLPDTERKRLRQILDKVKPAQHGIIVRTAALNVTSEEIQRDVKRLVSQWERIEELASKQKRAGLLYREPQMAVRLIREEFTNAYRAIMIDDEKLFEEISEYVTAITPALAERVQYFDRKTEPLPLFERYHVQEQLHRALDRKVWLPSGGSLIIEHTEALTVIDVNTGRNVGKSSLEETVFRNNLEAADEIARQLRLRDIGGIIVIDFVDMEIKGNRDAVLKAFKTALSRDKTRTQVFPISDLGLVEMTRKRIGEGLLDAFTDPCPCCDGRGVQLSGLAVDDGKMPPGLRSAEKNG